MAGPRTASSRGKDSKQGATANAETAVHNKPATASGASAATASRQMNKLELNSAPSCFNDPESELNFDNDSAPSFLPKDEGEFSIRPQTPSAELHRQSLWSQMQTPEVQNAHLVAVPPRMANAGDEKAREIEIRRVRDSIHEMASLLDEIQSMRSQSNVANLTSNSSNAHRSVLTSQSLHSANITDALTDTSLQATSVERDDLGARVPFLKPSPTQLSPLKMLAKPPSKLAPSPPVQKIKRRPRSVGTPLEILEYSIGAGAGADNGMLSVDSLNSTHLLDVEASFKNQDQRRLSAQTFDATQMDRRASAAFSYSSIPDESLQNSLDHTPIDLRDTPSTAPVPPPHGRSGSQTSIGTLSLLSHPSSRMPSVPARDENHRNSAYLAPSQSDVFKPSTNDNSELGREDIHGKDQREEREEEEGRGEEEEEEGDERDVQEELKPQVLQIVKNDRRSKRSGSASAPGVLLAAASGESEHKERRRRRVQSESRAATERRRRQQFSKETIENLLARDEQTSYTFAALELPPTEASLMERFVDALSKLSVEIQLDDRKREEGRRRMRNALNALEGWM